MPLGLCNMSAMYERLMEIVLKGLHCKTALIYIDNVIVVGQTFKEELERFRTAHMKLSLKKCLVTLCVWWKCELILSRWLW